MTAPSPNILVQILCEYADDDPLLETIGRRGQGPKSALRAPGGVPIPAVVVDPARWAPGARANETEGGEAAGWSPGQEESVKSILVIGDSMVRRARLRPTSPAYRIETWIPHGRTWRGCIPVLEGRARVWERACLDEGTIPWMIVIWLGSNDVYPRAAPPRAMSAQMINSIGDVLSLVGPRAMDGVVLLGPLPRPLLDRGMLWEETEAFRLDRALCTLVRDRLGPKGVVFVQCGRNVCERKHSGGGKRDYKTNIALFERDMVHLNAAGYARVSSRMPEGLGVGAAQQ